MCSSLQPVNQATHCAKIVLSAAVWPYNSDGWNGAVPQSTANTGSARTWLPSKNRWTNVLVENSLRLFYEVSQDKGSGGYLNITRQIQLLVPQLGRVSSQLYLRAVHLMNLTILSSLLNVAILYLNPFWWFHACSVWYKLLIPFISYNTISAKMIILYKYT